MGWDGMGWDGCLWGRTLSVACTWKKSIARDAATGCFLTIECPIPPSSRWDDFYAQDEWLG